MDSNAGCTKDIQNETMCVEEMIGEREREREGGNEETNMGESV